MFAVAPPATFAPRCTVILLFYFCDGFSLRPWSLPFLVLSSCVLDVTLVCLLFFPRVLILCRLFYLFRSIAPFCLPSTRYALFRYPALLLFPLPCNVHAFLIYCPALADPFHFLSMFVVSFMYWVCQMCRLCRFPGWSCPLGRPRLQLCSIFHFVVLCLINVLLPLF